MPRQRLLLAATVVNLGLSASKLGSGLLIGGESDPTYVQVLAEGGESTVTLINQNGVERLIKP
jgi:hypothetical protein